MPRLRLSFFFSEWLQDGWCSIQVLDTHAVEVDLHDVRVDPNNARRLTVSLPSLDDWLHLVVVSIWIGGLAYFVTGMRVVHQVEGVLRTRLTSLLIVRFSTLALSCVGLLGLTGLYSAILRVGSFSALFSTLYGDTLLIKLALAGPLLLLGAYNLLVLSPRLRQDRSDGVSDFLTVARFRRVITTEVILGVVVILCSSLLSSLPPVRITPVTSGSTGDSRVGDLQLDLAISPGLVGQNTFTLKITSDSQSAISIKQVLVQFTATRVNLPPSEIQLIAQGKGVYSTKGSYLSLADVWQVQVDVQRENQPGQSHPTLPRLKPARHCTLPTAWPATVRRGKGTDRWA
jgi:copper transport protein